MIKTIKFEDFFYNIKKLPPEETEGFDVLVAQEVDRCMAGVYVDGIFISGFLYWHLNHWWIRDDQEDAYGNIVRVKLRASLRDNEWIVTEYLEQCRVEKKGYMHIGARQFGKSEIMASYLSYHATLFEHTQNVIVGGNDDDLQLLRDKIDFGIKSLWKGLQIPKLDKDTRKNMTRLGFKARGGEDNIWSYLIVRNVAEGNKTEGPAGVTAKSFAIDEIGKFGFAQAYEAAKPAFMSKKGWRCVPLAFGTGGSFEKGADAERFFFHPEANNFLAVIDETTGKKTAVFMSGLYRIDCKYESTLYDYLLDRNKLDPSKSYPSLKKIQMSVTDKEKALALIKADRAEKAKDPDQTEYLKLVMYYPLTPEECFLTTAKNIFNIASAKKHQRELNEIGFYGQPVELANEGGRIIHEVSSKPFISSFPAKHNDNKDAPVMIYEFPVEAPPFGLYVAGVDPYRFGQAAFSDSLGTVAIFKRMHDINSEKFQNMFVASFAARPEEQDDWNETARNLIKFYNARTLCENDEMSFINYMIYKGDEYYLEEQPGWLKTLVPNSSVNRKYGIHRSNDTIRDYLHSGLRTFLNETLYREKAEDGSVIKEILGVSRIPDIMALEEIIKFNPDGNFDRLIAYELAVAMAKHLDPTIGAVGKDDPYLKSYFNRKNKRSTRSFTKQGPVFRASAFRR